MPLRKPAGKRRSTDSGVEPDRGALSQEKKDQRIALFLSDFDQQGRAGAGGELRGSARRRRCGSLRGPAPWSRPARCRAGQRRCPPARRRREAAAPGEENRRATAGARRGERLALRREGRRQAPSPRSAWLGSARLGSGAPWWPPGPARPGASGPSARRRWRSPGAPSREPPRPQA